MVFFEQQIANQSMLRFRYPKSVTPFRFSDFNNFMLVPLELDETLDRFVTLNYWYNTTSKFYPKLPRVDVSKSSYFCNHKFVKRLYHPGHFSLNLPYCEGSSPSFRRFCEASIKRSTIDFEELRAAPRAHLPLPPLRSPHQSFLPPFHLSSICLGNIPRSSLKQLPRFPARPHLPPPIQSLALSILPPPTEHPLPILLAPVIEPPPGQKRTNPESPYAPSRCCTRQGSALSQEPGS